MPLRAKHVRYARVVPQQHAELALILSCPACRAEGALLDGPDAHVALRQGLTYLALTQWGRQRVADAARLVAGAGGPHALIRDVARRELPLRGPGPERRLPPERARDERAQPHALPRHGQEAW